MHAGADNPLDLWQPSHEGSEVWKREDDFGEYTAYIDLLPNTKYRWSIHGQTYVGNYWEPPEYDEIASGTCNSAIEAAEEANEYLYQLEMEADPSSAW